ncbi:MULTISPECIES: hypothetical protein [unclassified Herbaspirillum]|uniref:hypothetical protein n=1 Tax=unclassified Herbaspirillum TaxID=2624150 RepID=UPI00114D9244|nr:MULTISPECIES: hypothetical protein [unclassified Herbaspirillum]MBB5393818.1 hypothetical protein [Herbaspirillum sp. SJZ102]TQK01325.1 hypothetical protein FB599_3810 [Herbaspirillum sp. SJZ130]TQK05721.1 hypothetical protein FB598_3750 [Herbaspirillum sp. SJZ106]TWC63252.1 hypothetical protein FB597_11198 [Herbaspirillum sp. SJZ099]
MAKNAHSELVRVLSESGEALLDLGLESEIVKAIPVVNLAAALMKEASNIRDKGLISKLSRFLNEPRLQRTLESEAMREKLLKDEYAELIGERLFLVIEKFSDLQKPVLLARVFAAYLNDELSRADFFLLAHAIDVAYIRDLERFLDAKALIEGLEPPEIQRLTNAGLCMTFSSGALGGGGLQYHPAPIAQILYNAVAIIVE